MAEEIGAVRGAYRRRKVGEWDWLFIPDGTQPCTAEPATWDGSQPMHTEYAKRACERCPFLAPCRAEGLVNRQMTGDLPGGIWGGLTLRERRRLVKDEEYVEECLERARGAARKGVA